MAERKKPVFKTPRYKKSKMPAKASDRQMAVINAYFENGFVKKAAMLAAGYAESTATVRSGVVFDHPNVVKEIERRRAKMIKKHELSQDWIIERFMRLANAGETLAKFKVVQEDGSLMWDFDGATEDELALVQELGVDYYTEGRGKAAVSVKKFKVKSPDVQAALIALARHLGLFNDKIELTGSLAERIQAGRDRAHKNHSEDTDDPAPTVH